MKQAAARAQICIIKRVLCSILCLISLISISSCRFFSELESPAPKLVFTFDDQHLSTYEVAFPMMQEYGFRGTNFVNTARLGQPWAMSWEQIRELELEHGWETGSHTLNHENLTTLEPAVAEANIRQDRQNLLDHGLCPRSFALPKGMAPSWLYPLLIELFENIRGSSDFAMHSPINRAALGYLPHQSKWSAEPVKSRILRGIANREALIIIGFHRFDADEDIFVDSCSFATFREILDFVESLNLEVIPLAEAF